MSRGGRAVFYAMSMRTHSSSSVTERKGEMSLIRVNALGRRFVLRCQKPHCSVHPSLSPRPLLLAGCGGRGRRWRRPRCALGSALGCPSFVRADICIPASRSRNARSPSSSMRRSGTGSDLELPLRARQAAAASAQSIVLQVRRAGGVAGRAPRCAVLRGLDGGHTPYANG